MTKARSVPCLSEMGSGIPAELRHSDLGKTERMEAGVRGLKPLLTHTVDGFPALVSQHCVSPWDPSFPVCVTSLPALPVVVLPGPVGEKWAREQRKS